MSNKDDIELLPEEEGDLPDLQKKIKKLKQELKECADQKKEYLDGWQRAKADHLNYKKDEGKRFEDLAQFVAHGLIEDLLPVLDSFDLAMGHGMAHEVEKGVLLIRSQFEEILKRRGLEVVKITPGETFNPERHESMGEMESEYPSGMIAEEVQRGYLLRGKMLRPARVRLSSKLKV